MSCRKMSRRDLMRLLGASGLAAGIGVAAAPGRLLADPASRKDAPKGVRVLGVDHAPATVVDGKVIQPRRELPLLHETDVLVIGGGPAGVSAALAAKRAGAEVTLVERYGHFGGLWTGGLVLTVLGHIVKGGKQVCQGIGEEMMRRLGQTRPRYCQSRPRQEP